jgi:ribosomal protein L37AE/L43A
MNTDPPDPRCPHCGCDEDHSRSFGLWKCGTSQKNAEDRGSKCHITATRRELEALKYDYTKLANAFAELRRENESLRESLAAYEATKHNQ